MDTEAESSFKIDLNKRGKGPKKRGGNTLHWDAARYVFLRVLHGELHKNAMVDAQKKYGISSSTLKATIADYIKAVEEHERVSRDDP